jgi:thiol-disulfide isomerase/thioredoxin
MSTSTPSMFGRCAALIGLLGSSACLPPPYDAPPEQVGDDDDDNNGDESDDTPFPNLDRLNREDGGHPKVKESRYGYAEGNVLPPGREFAFQDCNGERRTFADLLAENEDAPGGYWKGVVIAGSALYCDPCKNEAKDIFAPLADEFAEKGILFLNLIVHNIDQSSPSQTDCVTWDKSFVKGAFPIWYDAHIEYPDESSVFYDGGFMVTDGALPVIDFIDANANIRRRLTSSTDETTLRNELKKIIESPYGP